MSQSKYHQAAVMGTINKELKVQLTGDDVNYLF